jgi:hypothetical protein
LSYPLQSHLDEKPQLVQVSGGKVLVRHRVLGDMRFYSSAHYVLLQSHLDEKPQLVQVSAGKVLVRHRVLGDMMFEVDVGPDEELPNIVFTENDTNYNKLWDIKNKQPYAKDAFHDYVCEGQ